MVLKLTDDYGELTKTIEKMVIIAFFHQSSLEFTLGLQLFDVVGYPSKEHPSG